MRLLGNRRRVLQLLAPFAAPVNSDFRPYVQLESGRARFASLSAYALPQLALASVPVNEMLAGVEPAFLSAPVPLAASSRLLPQNHALELHRVLLDAASDASRVADADLRATLLTLKPQRVLCAADPSPQSLVQLHFAAELTLAHLGPEKRRSLWVEPRWTGCAPRDMALAVRQRFELYSAIAQRDAA